MVASAAERLTRQSYEGLMHRLLFKPLGMTHAGFGDMSAHGRIDGPWSHIVKADAITPIAPDRSQAVQTSAPTGRNVHGSIIDLARFAALHIHGAQGRSRFLRPETFQRLQTAVPPGNFAPGWAIAHPEWSKGTVLAQNGSNGQNYAVCRVDPAAGFAVCVTTNLGGDEASRTCESVLDWLVARVIRQRLTDDGSLASRPVPPRPDVSLERLTPEKATTGLGQVRINRTATD